MRPARILAVARRDLAQELRGRQGVVLPAIMAGLLLPVSLTPPLSAALPAPPAIIEVTGDVPPRVVDHPDIRLVDPRLQPDARPIRLQREDGTLRVRGAVPPALREALDDGAPAVAVIRVHKPTPIPGRSLLFALISASTLTGAIAASLAGERSHKTLLSLLTAAITRQELVVGKWLAWAGLGTASSLLAATIALLLGRLDPGWWLLPMATVPGATVALGLYMVRGAADVVGGTTVALRVLPAALSLAGVLAWIVGLTSPLLGSLLPLGGALLAGGDTWPGPAPALVASASTLGFTALALWGTARDLERTGDRSNTASPAGLAATVTAAAGVIWFTPILGPLLWSSAGNPRMTEHLSPATGVFAGALGLALLTAVHHARRSEPSPRPLPLPGPRIWLLAAATGGALALIGAATWLTPLSDGPLLAQAQLRLQAALLPGWAGAGVLALTLLADELIFRGWLLRRAGPLASVVAWTLVKCPLDPVLGLLSGGILAALARHGGVPASLLARGIWALGIGLLPSVGPWTAVSLGLLAWAALSQRLTPRPAPLPAGRSER